MVFRKSKERKGVKSVRRESPILKRISKGKSKYWPFKSETILISQEDIDTIEDILGNPTDTLLEQTAEEYYAMKAELAYGI